MSVVKSRLKAARDAIGKKDYAGARDSAEKVLDYEPDNYNANVFLGLACLEIGDHVKSEQAYLKAIDNAPTQLLAWQGLSRFYERTENWDKFASTLKRLLDLAPDATKCAETLQKLIQLRRTQKSSNELVDALSLLLPGSKYYPLLSTLPAPDGTNPTATTTFDIQEAIHNGLPVIEELVAIVEQDEAQTLKREVEKRRTRLNAAGPEQLRKDVGIEIWSRSRLPDLYNEIINHPHTSDELRRETENKLLESKTRYLFALPKTADAKKKLSDEVDAMVNGAIILKLPDELAWTLFLDRKDVKTVEAYDYANLRLYMSLFPEHPLTAMLKGYFIYYSIPLEVDEDEEKEDANPADDPDVGLDMVFDAQPRLVNSLIATRLLADVYLREADYANAIKITESGLELARRAETNHGKSLELTQLGFKGILATSLVHLFPPKHHLRALSLIDGILAVSPDDVDALMGRAYIKEEAGKWEDAAELFSRVDGLLPDDLNDGLRAKEEHAWCRSKLGDLDFAVGAFKEVLEIIDSFEDPGTESARCLWRLGTCYWDMGADTRNEAYKQWITALKRDPMYAPAFTSIGRYYEEQVSPADPVRASKCFQKAFELDSREVYAARRLAVGFAEEREWDLVEVVARRTIEGEGGLEAGLELQAKKSAALFTPMNAWAWKAVGAVELARRHYVPATQAFQVALRAEPEDQLSWLRLGEAYAKAGRHAAALKALTRAHELDPDDWMSHYFIGDVRRQTGQYQEAIDIFKDILKERPSEIGVSVTLATTYLELGRTEVAGGYMARAEDSFLNALRESLAAVEASSGFRGVIWKVAGDAMYHLSSRPVLINEVSVRETLEVTMKSLSSPSGDRLKGINVAIDLAAEPLTDLVLLRCAILAYDHRLSVSSSEAQALGSAWFDLATSIRVYATHLGEEEKAVVEKKGIAFISRALKEYPGVQEYWIALGDAYFITQPKSAQHAYIRALEVDSKSAAAWTNLGLLYLYHNDPDLANEALFRAQTLEPDYTLAWVGQALVATTNGHDQEAKALLEHAVGLASSVAFADLEFSYRIFAAHRASKSSSSHLSLLPCLTLLSRFLTLNPTSIPGLHLSSLIHEAISQLDAAQSMLSSVVSILEATYEETESAEVERQYVIAQANMGRVKLGAGDYEGALECFETVSGLLSEAVDEEAKTLRTQAHFGTGMAKFKQGGDFGEVSASFEEAMAVAADNALLVGHVSVLQAKAMWASGAEELMDGAKTILLECIENDPENLAAINTLAAMGILSDDESLIDAALSEILSLPREQRAQMDPQKEVDYLLIKHHQALGEDAKAISIAQHAIVAEPSDCKARVRLATLRMEQQSDKNSVLPIISGTNSASIDVESAELGLRAIARASADGSAALREAQRAVMLAPWDGDRWLALALVRSSVAQ